MRYAGRHEDRSPGALDRQPRSDRPRAGVEGASLKATEQPIDTSSAAGRAFLQMLGVSAEFQTSIRKERQMEGISAAKAAGVYKGRPPSIERKAVAALKAEGLGATEIAKKLNSKSIDLPIDRDLQSRV